MGGDEGVGGVVDVEDVDGGAFQGGYAAIVAAPELEGRVAMERRRRWMVGAVAEPERVAEGEVPACRWLAVGAGVVMELEKRGDKEREKQ
jgi:hypothetical protein